MLRVLLSVVVFVLAVSGAFAWVQAPLSVQDPCNQDGKVPDQMYNLLISQIRSQSFENQRLNVFLNFLVNLTRGFDSPQMVGILNSFSFSDTKVRAVMEADRYILGLTCDGVADILRQLPFSNDKLTILPTFLNTIIDPENNETIVNVFSMSSDKAKAREILAGIKKRSCVFGPTPEKRVQFLIDVSGSMGTEFIANDGNRYSRLGFVVKQLIDVMTKQLSSDQLFNIFSFANNVVQWKPGLVPVNSTNVASAIQFATNLRANGGTDIYSALQRAFADPNVVAIYLLTDGVPNVGVTNPDQIVTAAQKWSQSRNPPVAINTISFLVAGNESPADRQMSRLLMERIASVTRGIFRAIQ